MKKFVVALTMTLLMSCASLGLAANPYVLHPGNTIEVEVLHKIGKTNYHVDVDGNFIINTLGQFNVKNKTVEMLRAELTERYSKYVKNPEVIVRVASYGSMEVNVLGCVNHPGTVALSKSYTVVDAIAKAGGFNKKAAKRKVVLVHAGETKPYAIVNVQDILRGTGKVENISLEAGDSVYVESNGKWF